MLFIKIDCTLTKLIVSVENVEVFSRKLLCSLIKRAHALLIDNDSFEIIYSGKFSSDIKLLCTRPNVLCRAYSFKS